MKHFEDLKLKTEALPYSTEIRSIWSSFSQTATTCLNCGSKLEGRKCKLLCPRPGCGYMVTCSEW